MKSFVIVLLVVVTLAHISTASPYSRMKPGPPGVKTNQENTDGTGNSIDDLSVKLDIIIDMLHELNCLLQEEDEEVHEGAQGKHAESGNAADKEEAKQAPEEAGKRALTSVLRQLSYALGTRGDGDSVDSVDAQKEVAGNNGVNVKRPRRCGGNRGGNHGVNVAGHEENKEKPTTGEQDSSSDNAGNKRSKLARLEDLRRALANLEF